VRFEVLTAVFFFGGGGLALYGLVGKESNVSEKHSLHLQGMNWVEPV
jgi:hypothetical protein